ncbi:Transcriptional regulatory protein CusR [Klebsiella pneumoniae]|nr:Transcriptional regulatory protein CusR [Klebsiella pneumoniae]
MKILIVEDEIKTGEYLSKGLTEAGFVVDHADNGLTGYHLAMTAEYDLPRFYVSTSKSIIKALINMHSFEIQLSPIG